MACNVKNNGSVRGRGRVEKVQTLNKFHLGFEMECSGGEEAGLHQVRREDNNLVQTEAPYAVHVNLSQYKVAGQRDPG